MDGLLVKFGSTPPSDCLPAPNESMEANDDLFVSIPDPMDYLLVKEGSTPPRDCLPPGASEPDTMGGGA